MEFELSDGKNLPYEQQMELMKQMEKAVPKRSARNNPKE
jgi:hypothetical protein